MLIRKLINVKSFIIYLKVYNFVLFLKGLKLCVIIDDENLFSICLCISKNKKKFMFFENLLVIEN